MTADEADALLGIPYRAGSFGPDDFNCWGLLYYVQKTYFGVELPPIPVGNHVETLAIAKAASGDLWVRVDTPKHGDGALMRGGTDPHVGVYLDIDGGGILHALEGEGVVFTKLPILNTIGFGRTAYYRFTNNV